MNPKDEAVSALSTARKMLESPEPLTGVRRVQFRGLLEYAEEPVAVYLTVRKPRKAKA